MSEKRCCNGCGKSGVLLFPQRKAEDTETVWRCTDCLNIKTRKFDHDHMNNPNKTNETSHILRWKLCDEHGNEWIENHEHMTRSDFEVVYGNNIHEILWMTFRQENIALI